MIQTRRRAYSVYPGHLSAKAYELHELESSVIIISPQISIPESRFLHHEKIIRKYSDYLCRDHWKQRDDSMAPAHPLGRTVP